MIHLLAPQPDHLDLQLGTDPFRKILGRQFLFDDRHAPGSLVIPDFLHDTDFFPVTATHEDESRLADITAQQVALAQRAAQEDLDGIHRTGLPFADGQQAVLRAPHVLADPQGHADTAADTGTPVAMEGHDLVYQFLIYARGVHHGSFILLHPLIKKNKTPCPGQARRGPESACIRPGRARYCQKTRQRRPAPGRNLSGGPPSCGDASLRA